MNKNKNADFGKRLRDLRELKELERDSVATELGISVSTLSHWENGRSEPPFIKLKMLSELYQTSISNFFGEDDILPEEVKNSLLEDVVNSLIKDGTLEDVKTFEELDKGSQQMLLGAINKTINKVIERNKKDSVR